MGGLFSSNSYTVKVFHINVLSGDSTLIVVADRQNTLRGVLIDGGIPAAWEHSLKPALDDIQRVLTTAYKVSSFKLAAIVITHEHNDHRGGILAMLAELLETPAGVKQYFYNRTTDSQRTRFYTPVDPAKLKITAADFEEYIWFVPFEIGGYDYNYIGKELIWGEPEYDSSIRASRGPITLTASGDACANALSDLRTAPNSIADRTDGAPALYCLGVNQTVIKKVGQTDTKAITLTEPDVNQINATSMILVLTDQTDQIIHYIAGDAPAYIEQKFVDWRRATSDTSPSPCMKFSHHGSATSTPVELITTLSPTYGILSAGTAHGHPAWPIIAFCGFWDKYNNNEQLVMCANNYPYYLDPSDPQERINVDNMKSYRDAMNQIRQPRKSLPALPIVGTDREEELFNSGVNEAVKLVRGRWQAYGKPNNPTDNTGFNTASGYLHLSYNSSWSVTLRQGGGLANVPKKGPFAAVTYKRKPSVSIDPPAKRKLVRVTIRNLKGLLTASSYPTTAYTIALIGSLGSVPPTCPYFMYLQDDCSLDIFVNALPGSILILQGWTDSGNGSTLWGGSGTITDALASWFEDFGLSQVQIQISNSPLACNNGTNFTSVSSTQITIVSAVLTIGSSQISLQGASGGSMIQIAGSNGQPDLIWSFVLNSSAPLSSRQANVSDVLSSLQLITSGASFLGAFGTQTLAVDPSTTLIFDPSQMYSLNLSLALQINSTPVTIIPGPIGATNALIAMQGGILLLNQNRTYISDSNALDSFSWGPTTQLLINGTPYGQAKLSFQDENFIQVSLQLTTSSNAGSLVGTLLGSAAAYSRSPFQAIDPNLNQDLAFGVNLGLQLYLGGTTPTLVSMAIGGSLTLNLTSSWSLNFTMTVLYPSVQIYGTATLQKKVSDLVSNCPLCLQTATVTNFEMYADAVGNYSISALLDSTSAPINIVGPLSLSSVSIVLNKKIGATFDVQIEALLVLEDSTDPQLNTTTLQLTGGYINGQWLLSVWASDFGFSNLLTMIPSGAARNTVRTMIPNINFKQASFEANLSSNTFQIQATAILGGAFFDFSYQHVPANTAATPVILGTDIFNFNLSSGTGDVNLGDLFASLGITGIPSVVANLNLPFAAIALNYDFRQNVLTLSTTNEAQTFQIILSRYLDAQGRAQYFLRIIISGVSGFPLVGEMTLPLESFFLVYATDTSDANGTSTTSPPPGISQTTFNTTLSLQDEPDLISYRALSQMYANNPSFRISGLQAFIIGNDDIGVIGPLGASPPNVLSSSIPLKVGQVGDGDTPGGPSGSNTPATWIKIQKSFGPIYVNRIGFSIGSTVWILLDARLTFGPLNIQLQGLSVGLQISPLQFEPQFTLSGLGIDYSSGPLSINGSLLRVNPPPAGYVDLFQGGVTISYKPYTITAIGSYGRASNPDGDIVTFFVFGRVKAPFGGPPEAYVTGLAAGFGYNQTLNLPDIDNVNEFPLVQGTVDLGALSDDPFTTLQALFNTGPSPDLPWVVPNFNDGKWLAVGVDFTTYGLISTRALLTIGFGDLLEIAILGRSVFSLPKGPASIPKYVYIELGLRVLVQPEAGFWGVSAVLSPNSYVMGPFCRITGGFAWYNWFGNNPHAGDFVLTVGGYHPRFTPPSHYPNVPRVGYGWQYSDHIYIGGEAYFALTPNCVMAGGSYNLNFHAGDLRAWFNAKANAIVYWNPFWFDVDVGIRIGASYRVNCLLFSFSIKVELGAELEIWGPPIGGRIDVDLGPFGFTIDFGEGKSLGNAYLTWNQFLKTLPADSSGATTYAKILPSQGVVPANSPQEVTATPSIWVVRAKEYEFRVEFTFPATYVTWNGADSSGSPTTQLAYGQSSTLSIRSMNVTGFQALYQIQIKSLTDSNQPTIPGWQAVNGSGSSNPWSPGANDLIPNVTGYTLSTNALQSQPLPNAVWGAPLVDQTSVFSDTIANTVMHSTAINLMAPSTQAVRSISPKVNIDDLLTSAISIPLLQSQVQDPNDPYWSSGPNNVSEINGIKSDLENPSVTASRMAIVQALNAALTSSGQEAVYQSGSLTVLGNYVEVMYPDPPRSIGGSSASTTLEIQGLNINYSTVTHGNTAIQFTVINGSSSVWTYTVYINDLMILGPISVSTVSSITPVSVDQNVGYVYNPWTTYTLVVEDSNGNVAETKWPLGL